MEERKGVQFGSIILSDYTNVASTLTLRQYFPHQKKY